MKEKIKKKVENFPWHHAAGLFDHHKPVSLVPEDHELRLVWLYMLIFYSQLIDNVRLATFALFIGSR